jgi:hypothetical protein
MEDQIVTEVRKIREEHAKKFDYNLDKIYEDIKCKEIVSGVKTVSRQSKLFFKKPA